MARLAGCRKTSCRVVGIICPLVVRLMAAIASGRKARIVVVHMAVRTGDTNVGASKWKRRAVMIERALAPGHGVVADLAGGRETQLNVIYRRQGVVVVRLMASDAGSARQAVVVIDMTRRAGHADVRARQGKTRGGMVECRARPRGRGMANGAVGRKGRRHMAGVGRALVIGPMTIETGRAGQVVVIIDVAGSAGHRHVRAGQRESG